MIGASSDAGCPLVVLNARIRNVLCNPSRWFRSAGQLSPAMLYGKVIGLPKCATGSIAASGALAQKYLGMLGRTILVCCSWAWIHHVKGWHKSHREGQGGLRNFLLWSRRKRRKSNRFSSRGSIFLQHPLQGPTSGERLLWAGQCSRRLPITRACATARLREATAARMGCMQRQSGCTPHLLIPPPCIELLYILTSPGDDRASPNPTGARVRTALAAA